MATADDSRLRCENVHRAKYLCSAGTCKHNVPGNVSCRRAKAASGVRLKSTLTATVNVYMDISKKKKKTSWHAMQCNAGTPLETLKVSFFFNSNCNKAIGQEIFLPAICTHRQELLFNFGLTKG